MNDCLTTPSTNVNQLVGVQTNGMYIKTKNQICIRRKEGNVLFNDALNTYLRLYDVTHMVKDHSDSKRRNPLPPHRLLFPISSKGSFYMHHPTDRIAHTTAFVTPVFDPTTHRTMSERSYHGATSRSKYV